MKPTEDPPWMREARRHVGLKEIPGAKHQPMIIRWWQAIRSHFRDDETPWCAAFVGGCLEAVGLRSTRSAAARSYDRQPEHFRRISRPAHGCIVVFWRISPGSGKGHVAFLDGISEHGDLWCLGGNQSDAVTLAKFQPNRLVGYYWPVASDLDPADFPFRLYKGKGGVYSTNEA